MPARRYKSSTLPLKASRRAATEEQVMVKNAVVRPKRLLLWCLLGVFVLGTILFAASIFSDMIAFSKGPHAPHFRTFTEVFNEAMRENDIFADATVEWYEQTTRYKFGRFKTFLPDDSQVSCAVELWTQNPESSGVKALLFRFSKEQVEYIIPIAKGVFATINPAPTMEEEELFTDFLRYCKAPFDKELPEQWWNRLGGCNVTLYLDGVDRVTMEWYVFA